MGFAASRLAGRLSVIGAALLLLSACKLNGTVSKPVPSEQAVQLHIWAPATDRVDPEILSAFERQHANVRVSYVEQTWVASSPWPFDAGKVDVVVLPPGAAGAPASKGVLRELSGDLARESALFAGRDLWNSMALEGKRYDLPMSVSPLVVFTWPDLAGKPPQPRWTWRELLGLAEAAAAKPQSDGAALHGLAVHPTAGPMLRAMNVQSFLSGGVYPLPDVLYLNMDESLEAGLAVLHALFHGPANAYLPPADEPDAALNRFAERNAAMLLVDYETGLASLKGVHGWQVHLTPKLSNMHVPVGAITTVAVAAGATHPEEAFRLAAFLAGEEASRQRAAGGKLPARNSLQPGWLSMGGHLVSYPRLARPEEAEFAAELDRAAETLVHGSATPQEALAKLKKRQAELCARWSGPRRPQNCSP